MRNTKNIINCLLVAATAVLGTTSCSKEEGKGGDAIIHGYVYEVVNDGDIVSDGMGGYKFDTYTVPAMGKTVYIVYGGGIGANDDKVATNSLGYYRFENLRKGDYSVYAIGDNATSLKEGVITNINIGSSGAYMNDAIYLSEGKNSACSGVIGSVKALYSNEDDYVTGVGIRVYIKNSIGGEQNDTRTDNEGNFRFARLKPNSTYTIWAETEVKKNYAVTATGYDITTGPAGTVTNMTASPIKVSIF